jgi:hypothetical protein
MYETTLMHSWTKSIDLMRAQRRQEGAEVVST